MTDLTDKQIEVYKYIRCCIGDGVPPTVREVAEQFGMKSPNGAKHHIDALEKKGFLSIEPGMARSIRLTGKLLPSDKLEGSTECCPLCGHVV